MTMLPLSSLDPEASKSLEQGLSFSKELGSRYKGNYRIGATKIKSPFSKATTRRFFKTRDKLISDKVEQKFAMNNHQKKAKLKTSTSEFVEPLLNRLKLAKKQVPKNPETENIINQIIKQVEKKKDILDSIGDWDMGLTAYFGQIERKIDEWIDYNYKMTEWIEPTIPDIIDILNQLSINQRSNPPEVGTKNEVGESSNGSYEENEFSMVLKWIESVGPQAKSCLYSLCNFPLKTKLKKRLLIYWWIGLGLVSFWEDTNRTAEQLGEIFFSGLVKKGVLIPEHTREHNQVIDCCTIQPTNHKQLISACERQHLISFDKRENGICDLYDRFNKKGLLNLDENYLNSKDISGKDDTLVIQLGRWRYIETEVGNGVEEIGSEETKLKDHFEVDKIDFLKELGAKVTYLSLRGISGIEELHESIGKLKDLIILDLKACHNLQKLPQKPRSILKESSWFEKLMVLDISECYLLDHMPKWLCELSYLEVLKGFVVSYGESKTEPCQVRDLSKLIKLRKLSIRISSDQLVKDDFIGLKNLDKLLILTIIWRQNKNNSSLSPNNMSNDTIPTYSFPKNLEKLDIRCYPEAEASKLLNPTELTNLKRLYIRGGKLSEIPYNENWKVEILRLRFLANLEIDWVGLRRSFKNLKYMEIVKMDGSRWGMDKDELSAFVQNVDDAICHA